MIGRYAQGVPSGGRGTDVDLMYSFGARVCADWVSLGLWISLSLSLFGIAGYFYDCVMGGPGLS